MRPSNRTIRIISITPTRNILRSSTSTTRHSYNFRIAVDDIARNGFLDGPSATSRITKVAARQTRNTAPWSIITPIVPSAGSAVIRTIMTIVATVMPIVTVVTRMRISLVVR